MKPKVIVINGYPGAGKDTFVKLCSHYSQHVFELHTSSPAKNALTALGWNGQKSEEIRNLLASLMVTGAELFDSAFMYVQNQVTRIRKRYEDEEIQESPIIFVHCREPQNIDRYVQKFGAMTLFIERDLTWDTTKPINDSDALVALYSYDHTIDNNGSEEELELAAREFIIEFGGN